MLKENTYINKFNEVTLHPPKRQVLLCIILIYLILHPYHRYMRKIPYGSIIRQARCCHVIIVYLLSSWNDFPACSWIINFLCFVCLKWAFIIPCCPSSSVFPFVCRYMFHIFIFSKTTEQISTKLITTQPWVTGIQICLNKGLRLFPRGDDIKIA